MLDHIAAAVATHRRRQSLSALPPLPPECPIHDAPLLEPRQPVIAVTLPCPTTQRRRGSRVPAAARAPKLVARPNPLPSLTAPPGRASPSPRHRTVPVLDRVPLPSLSEEAREARRGEGRTAMRARLASEKKKKGEEKWTACVLSA